MTLAAALAVALLALPCRGQPLACHLHVYPSSAAAAAAGPAAGAPVFTSITGAQAALRSGAAPRAPSGPTRVCLHAGAYAEALRFERQDSGAGPQAPTIYAAAPGQNVSLTGALPIALAPLPADDPARALLPPAAAARALVADLAAAGVPSASYAWLRRGFGPYGGCQASPLELTLDGAVQRTARWPNAGDASQGTTRGFALTAWHAPSQGLSNGSLWVNASDGSAPWLAWREPSTLQLHGFWHFEWADGLVGWGGTAEADGDLVRVLLAGAPAEGSYGTTVGAARYYVTNALEALDEEGEYFVNASSARLYYMPGPQGLPPGAAAAVTVNTTLVTFAPGTADVWLVGVTLEASRGHGVALEGTRGIVLLNLTLRALGQDGVNAFQSNNTLVAGASISDTGCSGVRFTGGGDRLALAPSGNAVVDSTITRAERLCFTYNPPVQLDSGGLAAHNDVHDAPHHCIGLEGNDVAILGNLLHNCTRWTWDNAAIYWYPMDWSKRNTTLRHNFLYLNAQDANTCNSATSCNRDTIYPDNGSAGVLVESNVIFHPRPPASNLPCLRCSTPDKLVSYAVFQDGTRECVQRNNMLVLDGSNWTFNGGAGVTWDKAQQGNASTYLQALRAVEWDTPGGLYATRYPALAELQGYWPEGGALACAAEPRCGAAPYGNVLSTNVVVGAAQLLTPPPAPFFAPAMFNVSGNLVTAGDPGWASADPRGTLNFSLAPDSPAFALGFVQIPECFGPGQRCPGEPDWGAAARALAWGA